MEIRSFGEYVEGIDYKVLDERELRASAGIMFLLGLIAFINAFTLHNFAVVPYISGFLALNFTIGIFINSKFAPTMMIASLIVHKQKPIYVGAIQKKFAWSLGLALAVTIFGFSLFLVSDFSFFKPVCAMCMICLVLIYTELAFGICIGCKLYYVALHFKLMKEPEVKPNCIGDACEVENK